MMLGDALTLVFNAFSESGLTLFFIAWFFMTLMSIAVKRIMGVDDGVQERVEHVYNSASDGIDIGSSRDNFSAPIVIVNKTKADKCEYCGSKINKHRDNCSQCGAPYPDK